MSERAIQTRAISAAAVEEVARLLPWIMGGLTIAIAYQAAGKVPAIITGIVALGTHSLEWRRSMPHWTLWPLWLRLLRWPLAELFWVVAYSVVRHTPLNFFVAAFIAYEVVGWLLSYLFAWLIAGSFWDR